jgi:K+-sensing histidine kinase KdpD
MAPWKIRSQRWLDPILGAVSCAGIAALLSIFFRNSSLNTALPFCFLVIILVVAIRFGFAAALVGTILAEAVFACLMFKPFYRLTVQSHGARNSLLWMFFGGLALSELFSQHPRDGGTPNFRRRAL